MPKTKKQSNSRSARCGRACDAIREVAGHVRDVIGTVELLIEQVPEEGDTITIDENKFKDLPLNADDEVGALEELKEELQSWFDNLPESLQGSDTGSRLEEAIGNLESATDTITGADWPEAPEGEVTSDKLEEFRDDLDTLADALESGADEAEATEFPGMYGR